MRIALPPVATFEQAAALLAGLDGADEIDASALVDFDTSVLALLLEAQRRALARGGSVAVAGAPAKLVELARLYGVDTLLFAPAAAG